MDGLIGDNAGGVALERADRCAVADEVPRVTMIGQRVVLGSKPVIETVIIGLRLAGYVEAAIHVPLANVRGIVSALAQNARDGDLTGKERAA